MAEMDCKFGRLLSGATPILDPGIVSAIGVMDIGHLSDRSRDDSILHDFVDSYDRWIRASKLNSMIGFEAYERYMVFAVTNAIEQFLMKHRNKRIRTFKGEYPGTTELIRGYGLSHSYLVDDRVVNGDAVIVSAPFSASGDIHPMMDSLLDDCDRASVPVMIDCAFFGTCKGLHLKEKQCIETVAFSLSKCYCLNYQRIGMVYSKDAPFGIELLHRAGYTARFAAALAMGLFGIFGPDYVYSRYSAAQAMACRELGNLSPSNTVLFGKGDQSWKRFSRDGGYNRVSFADFLPRLVDV